MWSELLVLIPVLLAFKQKQKKYNTKTQHTSTLVVEKEEFFLCEMEKGPHCRNSACPLNTSFLFHLARVCSVNCDVRVSSTDKSLNLFLL